MDTLFSHATVVTMNDQMAVLPDAFVGVTGGKICYLSSEPPQEHPAQIIDATGLVMMPGLDVYKRQAQLRPLLQCVVPMAEHDHRELVCAL